DRAASVSAFSGVVTHVAALRGDVRVDRRAAWQAPGARTARGRPGAEQPAAPRSHAGRARRAAAATAERSAFHDAWTIPHNARLRHEGRQVACVSWRLAP